MSEHSLTTIPFHGADLMALGGATPDKTLVAMKPVVEGMGLDWKGQYDKIKTHPVLSQGMGIIPIPSAGGIQEMVALPLNRLNFWLATIQPNRVPNADTRAKIITYQTECADILFSYFFGRGGATPETLAAIMTEISDMRREMARLAEGHDQSQSVVNGYLPVLWYLDTGGALQKGRGGLVRKCSARLMNALQYSKNGDLVRICKITKRRLFHYEEATEWFRSIGNTLIREHNDRITGQSVLPFTGIRRTK